MNLDIDLGAVTVIEFGIGRDELGRQTYEAVPVDAAVQDALREMAASTWEALQRDSGVATKYEPSEKHAPIEYLYLPLSDELSDSLRDLHEAANIPINAEALDDSDSIFCYYARLTDSNLRRLTAIRRSTQFKGVLKSRLIRLISDSLKLIDDRVFKLDADFDILVDSTTVHILRPSGFEFAGKLQEAILRAVPANIRGIQRDLAFVDWSGVEKYARGHPRAARYLASIRSERQSKSIDKSRLKRLCRSTRVEVTESNGIIVVSAGHELGFLEVLDRRRYELELVSGRPEQFKAASRTRIDD